MGGGEKIKLKAFFGGGLSSSPIPSPSKRSMAWSGIPVAPTSFSFNVIQVSRAQPVVEENKRSLELGVSCTDAEVSVSKVFFDQSVTEQLDDDRWQDFCRFILLDVNDKSANRRLKIRGCNAELYMYQAYGVSVMFEMEMFQNGGYNANDMD